MFILLFKNKLNILDIFWTIFYFENFINLAIVGFLHKHVGIQLERLFYIANNGCYFPAIYGKIDPTNIIYLIFNNITKQFR